MSAGKYTFNGSCHCGAITVELAFITDAASTQVRSCQCGFCTRQGAMTVSDPAGQARIDIAGPLATYQFATRTGKSLICGTCGVYVGVMLEHGGQVWSVANVRGLAIAEFKDRVGEAARYDHETAAERIERRQQRWTPTEIRIKV